ncbi:5491_t:CDS:1 [Cetraspora pellucida]|uniref:5491_t:CDS:1 n=1 Tax=Cetraspora pellucida TaxID=1433469 RepID=A0ACA9KPY9_9GLOM|nr:5491_t:CDS:1 [Cetraspora pellucida]
MVKASEWLEKIPKEKRGEITGICIHKQCLYGHIIYNYNCNNCKIENYCYSGAPNYQFFNTTLEGGDLGLNDFVTLQQLQIYGIGQDRNQQHTLDSLTIDKCIKLTNLTINYMTLKVLNVEANINLQDVNLNYNHLDNLSLGRKINLRNISLKNNKRLTLYDDTDKTIIRLKGQVETLIKHILNEENLKQLKLTAHKFAKENFEHQKELTKSKLDKHDQILFNVLFGDSNASDEVKQRLSDLLGEKEIDNLVVQNEKIKDYEKKEREN